MRAAAAALLLLLLSVVASLAQTPVTAIGAVTPGHCVSFFSTTQLQDSGSACGGGGGGGIVGPGTSIVGDLAVWNNATGTALADTNLSFPGGFSFAGTLTGPTTVTFPLTGNLVSGPASSTVGDLAVWNSTTGSLADTNLSFVGAFSFAGTLTGPTTVTFPTSGTLATTANANVASVTGTAGQVTASPTTGAVVVGLPATITANLTFSGTVNHTATLTTNVTGGGTQCLQASNTGVVSGTGAVCSAGGGTPGGANTNVQFNSSGTFGGDSGFTYAGTGQATLALGTITTNNKALNITGTWNAAGTTFDAPLGINITNTASAAASSLFDFAVGANSLLILQPNTNSRLSLAGGATASVFRVYNTVDTLANPTNYERGIFDWTTAGNALTIGTEAGGTGSNRPINLRAGGVNLIVLAANNTGFLGAAVAWNSGQVFSWHANAQPGWVGSGGPSGATDTNLNRAGPGVVGFHTSAAVGHAGWFNYGGQTRVTADFSVTSSTTLVNVTGLSVTVTAGRTYMFQAQLYVTDAAAGGVQAAIAGTATATNINYTGYTLADNSIKAKTNATALATAVGSTVTTETSGIIVGISGTITVNAGGTLTVQMAQNTSNATATVAKQGSWFLVNDMP